MASTNSWRLRPRDGRKFPIRITEEIHTVEFNSDWNSWGIQLNEAPILSDSSISAPIMLIVENDSAETEFTEVPRTSGPSVGQYVVDYEQDGYFGTGRIEFNSADGGTSVKVTYWGMGILFTQSNIAAALDGQDVTMNDLAVEGDAVFAGNVLNAIPQIAVFTSSGTWTVPIGVTKCYVKVIGAGGGGGGSQNSGGTTTHGGGGGGGGVSEKRITGLTPGANITVTVGTGGTGGTAGINAGATGGTSSFGAHCSATGGSGGSGTVGNYDGGNGGIGSSGDLNYSLGAGQAGYNFSKNTSDAAMRGPGGAGGGPGGRGNTDAAGSAGYAYGGGGAGGAKVSNGSTNFAGGNGADGVVIIWY